MIDELYHKEITETKSVRVKFSGDAIVSLEGRVQLEHNLAKRYNNDLPFHYVIQAYGNNKRLDTFSTYTLDKNSLIIYNPDIIEIFAMFSIATRVSKSKNFTGQFNSDWICLCCKGDKKIQTDMWNKETMATYEPCPFCCNEEHDLFYSDQTTEQQRQQWYIRQEGNINAS